jgi:hypothetical protein
MRDSASRFIYSLPAHGTRRAVGDELMMCTVLSFRLRFTLRYGYARTASRVLRVLHSGGAPLTVSRCRGARVSCGVAD